MMMRYAARPLRESDFVDARRIERQAFPSLFPPTPFRREARNANARYWVAVRRSSEPAAAPTPPPAPVPATWRSAASGAMRRALGLAAPAGDGRRVADSGVVGFLGSWYAADEAHVVTIGVGNDHRRQGVGELLLFTAISHATDRGAECVTLEVRESNAAARALYEKYGFTERGVRKRYYSDNREDAVIMTTPSLQTPAYASRFAQLRLAHRRRWGAAEVDVGA